MTIVRHGEEKSAAATFTLTVLVTSPVAIAIFLVVPSRRVTRVPGWPLTGANAVRQ